MKPANELRIYRALTIAGSDSGGGAGIQADLKTFSALGVYGTSAITALTSQNTLGISEICLVNPKFVEKQIKSILDDIGADSIKIGMTYRKSIMQTISDCLEKSRVSSIVIDPVMFAKDGTELMDSAAIQFFKKRLIPLAQIITPNLSEASALTGERIENRPEMECAAKQILNLGARGVLIKGGHLSGLSCPDCLGFINNQGSIEIHWFEKERIETKNTHGTGCTLSSAIAAFLAKGYKVEQSVLSAKDYLTSCLKISARTRIGSGFGPLCHFLGYSGTPPCASISD